MTEGRPPPRHGNALWWSTLLGLCLVLLAPLTIVEVPPLLDYPNHLARLFVLASGDADPVLRQFYGPHWGIIPNLALDVTVPPLLRLWPVHAVGRVVLGIILLLPVLGAAAYHRALSGRLSFWPLGAALFAYNAALLRGFLNFVIAEGLALLLAAVWVAWRETRPLTAILTAALGATALFFCHLIGLLCFAILIGAHELAWLLNTPGWWGRPVLRRAGVVALVFAGPALLYALSDLGHLAGGADFRSVLSKARTAVTPVINYLWPLDLATAALCVLTAILCVARRWCVIPLQAGVALAVLVALFLGLPHAFKQTFDLDTRFIIMAAAMAPAALVPVAVPRRAAWIIGIGFLLLFGARMGVLMTNWAAWRGELAGLRAVIASVRPGDAVMTFRLPRAPDPSIWDPRPRPRLLSDGTLTDAHFPALLVIEHRAWWPFLFDIPSQQPIETHEPFRTLTTWIDTSPDPVSLLTRGDVPGIERITHVLMLGVGRTASTDGLEPVASNERATLFRVPRVSRR